MKRMRSKQLLPVLSAILLASGALAEDNLTKLGQFKTTGVTEFTTIAQDGPAANSIRNILRTIELPLASQLTSTRWCPMPATWRWRPKVQPFSWARRKKKSGWGWSR